MKTTSAAQSGIPAPINLSITGNLAVSARFFASTRGKTPEEFVLRAVQEYVHAYLTHGFGDDEADEFLGLEKEVTT